MDVWNLILYVVASLLALKSLASLMTHHRKVVVQQLAIEYTQEIAQKGKKVSSSDSLNQRGNHASADQKAPAA
tara:strand:+ start:99471 stop:99689 length:219 start_codon:yes stop_codon:yes gene_type:complete